MTIQVISLILNKGRTSILWGSTGMLTNSTDQEGEEAMVDLTRMSMRSWIIPLGQASFLRPTDESSFDDRKVNRFPEIILACWCPRDMALILTELRNTRSLTPLVIAILRSIACNSEFRVCAQGKMLYTEEVRDGAKVSAREFRRKAGSTWT